MNFINIRLLGIVTKRRGISVFRRLSLLIESARRRASLGDEAAGLSTENQRVTDFCALGSVVERKRANWFQRIISMNGLRAGWAVERERVFPEDHRNERPSS